MFFVYWFFILGETEKMFVGNSFLRNKNFLCALNLLKVEKVAHLHSGCISNKWKVLSHNGKLLKQNTYLLEFSCPLRYASTGPPTVADTPLGQTLAKDIANTPIDPIPEAPEPLSRLSESVAEVVSSGEPSFSSLGLGGYSPVGIIQSCMEYLHVSCDLPWWGAIVIGTAVVRILMFPLVIMAQRNAAKMNNHLPQLQMLQLKMTEARQRGDKLDAARYGAEMVQFMKEKNLNPLKNVMVPLAQAPVFISFFMSLRGMTNIPVDSMRTGGLLWFMDLTLPDQYYLLSLITSTTLWITIEVGTDSVRLKDSNMMIMKYVLRFMPVIVFPVTMNFPSAILVYWVSSNMISLVQVGFLRIPRVRQFFKIEQLVKHDTSNLPIKDKGFVKGVSESWTNLKISKELEDRERLDQVQFMQAGRGAVKKTYKYDPTQSRLPSSTSVQAKKQT